MKTLLLSPLQDGTGNATTMRRIAEHLGSETLLLPIHQKPSAESLVGQAAAFAPDVMIGIHALRAGPYLLELQQQLRTAYAVILGGTDINELHDAEHPLLHDVIGHSAAVVAFAPYMADKARKASGGAVGDLRIIPPSVTLHPSERDMRAVLAPSKQDILAVLPAGLRAVKDPLFLRAAAEDLHQRTQGAFRLVVAGPPLEEHVAAGVRDADHGAGYRYVGAMTIEDLHATMVAADIVVNSSRSEGLSNAVLEGMTAGKPILARNNEGNAAAIEHGISGMLFESPEDFTMHALDLLHNRSKMLAIGSAARQRAAALFSPAAEAAAYRDLAAFLAKQKQ